MLYATEREEKSACSSFFPSLLAIAMPTDVFLLTLISASLCDPSPHTDFVFNFP